MSYRNFLFGPEAGAPDKKVGPRAEARTPKEMHMLNVVNEAHAGNAVARKIGAKTVVPYCGALTLTPTEAQALLDESTYPDQDRHLKPAGQAQIAVLADIMRRGQWRSHNQIDFAELDGKITILNGHHSLSGQVKSGKTITWNSVVHPCASMEDMQALYYTFDTNVRMRSNATILRAADAASLLQISKTMAEALFRTVPLIAANFDFARKAQDPVLNRVIDRRIGLMKAYADDARVIEEAVSSAPAPLKKKLYGQGALAVALITARHQRRDAIDFWGGVAENDGLVKGDPRRTYRDAALMGSGSGSSELPAKQAAIAWNAFFKNKSIGVLKVNSFKNFVILGTPVGR